MSLKQKLINSFAAATMAVGMASTAAPAEAQGISLGGGIYLDFGNGSIGIDIDNNRRGGSYGGYSGHGSRKGSLGTWRNCRERAVRDYNNIYDYRTPTKRETDRHQQRLRNCEARFDRYNR